MAESFLFYLVFSFISFFFNCAYFMVGDELLIAFCLSVFMVLIYFMINNNANFAFFLKSDFLYFFFFFFCVSLRWLYSKLNNYAILFLFETLVYFEFVDNFLSFFVVPLYWFSFLKQSCVLLVSSFVCLFKYVFFFFQDLLGMNFLELVNCFFSFFFFSV